MVTVHARAVNLLLPDWMDAEHDMVPNEECIVEAALRYLAMRACVIQGKERERDIFRESKASKVAAQNLPSRRKKSPNIKSP